MRLVTYHEGNDLRAGVDAHGLLLDTATLLGAATTNRALLCSEDGVLSELAGRVAAGAPSATVVAPTTDRRLGPPVPDPDKILCVGLNYDDHVREAGRLRTEHPTLFAKFRNSLVGPADDIVLPRASDEIDYEGELAVVIGRAGAEIPVDRALDHVAGAMVVNDVSARDLQHRTSQWLAGKAIDTFAPCGPALVTLDELGDVQDLRLRTRVNGRVVQDASTATMIFSVAEIVASIAKTMTLTPGDIICTGTPGGVGFKREPQLWLTPGDEVEVEVDGIGRIANACRRL